MLSCVDFFQHVKLNFMTFAIPLPPAKTSLSKPLLCLLYFSSPVLPLNTSSFGTLIPAGSGRAEYRNGVAVQKKSSKVSMAMRNI